MAASGLAVVLIPLGGWRVLWFAQLPHLTQTFVVTAYGLAWGLVYWGFITFLPSELESTGNHGMSAATLLFLSSLLAVPTCAVAAWMYTRWSAKGTMVVYAALTVAALLALAVIGLGGSRPLLLATVMLLFAGTVGVIALLGPYTAALFVALPMAAAVAVAVRGTSPRAGQEPLIDSPVGGELDELLRDERVPAHEK